MKEVTVVTGPMRSGTSCITGLLELCGFNLGQNLKVLRNPTPYNPKGHFELGLLFTINERLCYEASGGKHGMFHVPELLAMDQIASQRDRYFQLFIRKFDGDLCKDPLMCLTWSYWERHWPGLKNAVFCLRNPLASAHSMANRYQITVAQGLELWVGYTERFFYSAKRCRTYILDFDVFCENPIDTLSDLLQWLGRPIAKPQLQELLDGFFGLEFVHIRPEKSNFGTLPDAIQYSYDKIRSMQKIHTI